MSNLPEVILENDNFKLSMRDRELCFAMVLRSQTGETVQQVADRFELSRNTVYQIMKKPEYDKFQRYIYDQMFQDMYGQAVVGMTQMLHDKTTPKALKVKLYGMILQAHGKAGGGVTVNVNQPKDITLEELERDTQILELEAELLEGE